MKPRLYNRNMQFVCALENATRVTYTHAYNDLYTASFELPVDDPKNALCETHFIVDIFDGEVSKGKYRIVEEAEAEISANGEFIRYECEHVLAFLLDNLIDEVSVMGGIKQIEDGGGGFGQVVVETTREVLQKILSLQTVKRWVLGKCDFFYYDLYTFESINLLDAIFTVPTVFPVKYHWTYDTDSYPWTINLYVRSTVNACVIRRNYNMQSLKRSKDSSGLCTRLYCYGSVEDGVQVNIKGVNPTGEPYIDADTIGTYGVICAYLVDRTIPEPGTLIARGRALLEEIKHPHYTYSAKAVDLMWANGLTSSNFEEGKYVRIVDTEKNVDIDAIIIEVTKGDVDGDPLDMDIVISNKPSDVSGSLEDLKRRAALNLLRS